MIILEDSKYKLLLNYNLGLIPIEYLVISSSWTRTVNNSIPDGSRPVNSVVAN